MKKHLVWVAVLAVCLSAPTWARAEIREGSVHISPMAGLNIADASVDHYGKTRRLIYGLGIGYNFTKNWGIEAMANRVENRANFYHADLLYHFNSDKALNPYLVAGLGYAKTRPAGSDSYGTFLGNFGVGLKYFLAENVALRADVRDYVTNMHNIAATAGLTLAFGGKTPKAPEPAPMAPPPPPPAPKAEPAPPPPPPAPKMVEPVPPPPPAPEPVKIVLEDVHFDFDKATLTKEAVAILDRNVSTLKQNPKVSVQIEGHTCAHGAEDYNMALGERRANAVKEYLSKAGIGSERMTTISYGETRLMMPEIPTPKNKNSTEAKANRRVHFEVFVK